MPQKPQRPSAGTTLLLSAQHNPPRRMQCKGCAGRSEKTHPARISRLRARKDQKKTHPVLRMLRPGRSEKTHPCRAARVSQSRHCVLRCLLTLSCLPRVHVTGHPLPIEVPTLIVILQILSPQILVAASFDLMPLTMFHQNI